MKTQIIFALILTLVTLISKSQNISTKNDLDNKTIANIDFKEKLLDFLITNCDDKAIELPFLYDSLSTKIPEDSADQIILVQSLKKRGFKINDWGRGNHANGPRIISITMSNGNCECQVMKIYYLTEDKDAFEMSERIKCKNVSR